MKRLVTIAAQVALIGASALPFAAVGPDVVDAHRAAERAEAQDPPRTSTAHHVPDPSR